MRVKKHRFSWAHYIIQKEPSVRPAVRGFFALSPNRKQLTLSQKDSTVISLRGPHVWWQPGFIGSHCGSLQAPTRRNPTRSSTASEINALAAPHSVIVIARVSNINGSCFTTIQSSLYSFFFIIIVLLYYNAKNRKENMFVHYLRPTSAFQMTDVKYLALV